MAEQNSADGARNQGILRDEIHEAEVLFLKGHKITIPASLRSEMLDLIHETVRSKERARAVMYWPNMTRDIEQTVSRCSTCQRLYRSLTKETATTLGLKEAVGETRGRHLEAQSE